MVDAIDESDANNDVGEMDEAAQLSPTLFGILPQLEHHVKHTVSAQAALGSLGTMTDRREGAFDGTLGSAAPPANFGCLLLGTGIMLSVHGSGPRPITKPSGLPPKYGVHPTA